LFNNGATNFEPMNPNPHNLGKLTFDNSTRFQLRTLDCTYDGFCTGEGGPVMEPATNYIPKEQLDKKLKENEQQKLVAHISEGFSSRRSSSESMSELKKSHNFAPFIPRATATSNAKEQLAMRS